MISETFYHSAHEDPKFSPGHFTTKEEGSPGLSILSQAQALPVSFGVAISFVTVMVYACPRLFSHVWSTTTLNNKLQIMLWLIERDHWRKKKKRFYLFREIEGKEGRKWGRETSMCGSLLCAPNFGLGPQPSHVPWLGITGNLLVY